MAVNSIETIYAAHEDVDMKLQVIVFLVRILH